MNITFRNIKKLMESKKYLPTDKLVWDTMKSIKRMQEGEQKGQDIYSVCLEGEPGSGKTFYVASYKKLLEELFGEDIIMVEYSCDSTTGKTDLYEDIRVSSAITGNGEDVIISGKLIEAIESVNAGKKVIVRLDEFEKSRRETDSFLFQFLQEGKVITSQKGVVEVKPEYKRNLQVFLCKNDERELSDPLLRRNHIIRLELMTPENFYKTVKMNLPDHDEDVINIVTLLYQKMYNKKEEFTKFPSCSEGLIAIQDACTLLNMGAPAEVIYADILSNMLKHPDDIDTFAMLFQKDKQLSEFCNKLLSDNAREDNELRQEIYKSFFSEEIQQLSGMKEKYEKHKKNTQQYRERIKSLEKQIKELSSREGNNQGDETSSELKKNLSVSDMNVAQFEEVDVLRARHNRSTRRNCI